MYQGNVENKISVGWHYVGVCCPMDVAPDRWAKRDRARYARSKKKTLRTHRTGR